jgi:hypothetical protein
MAPLLCLDFDGVCHSYTSGWKGATIIPDEPVTDLFEFMLAASRHFEIAIYSSRSHQPGGRAAMVNWFIKYGPELACSYTEESIVWYSQVTKVPLLCLTFPTEKPPAFVTIDDRALTFTGIWPSIDTLINFRPWNK